MKDFRRKPIAVTALFSFLSVQLGTIGTAAQQFAADHQNNDAKHDRHDTETPIKHVIVIIGENRTFDNIYGTYVPKHGETVSNLLSKGIVNADGSPGWNRGAAEQFKLTTINPVSYFISTNTLTNPNKTRVLAVSADARSRCRPAASRDARAVPENPVPIGAARSTRKTFSPRRAGRRSTPGASSSTICHLLTTGATGLSELHSRTRPSRLAVPGARHARRQLSTSCRTPSFRSTGPNCRTTATPATWCTASFTCGSSRIAMSRTRPDRPGRLPERSVSLRRHRARRRFGRQRDGLLQHAEGRRAALQAPRRRSTP